MGKRGSPHSIPLNQDDSPQWVGAGGSGEGELSFALSPRKPIATESEFSGGSAG